MTKVSGKKFIAYMTQNVFADFRCSTHNSKLLRCSEKVPESCPLSMSYSSVYGHVCVSGAGGRFKDNNKAKRTWGLLSLPHTPPPKLLSEGLDAPPPAPPRLSQGLDGRLEKRETGIQNRKGNRNRNRNRKRNRNRNGKRNLHKSRDNVYLNLS